MRKNVLIALLIVSSVCLADSVQQGCVKTRGRMINGKHVPGQGLPGSVVSIKDRTAIGVKNSNGTFSFPVTDNQFRVDSVKKKDYVLLDADAASKTYTHTADTLFFVMETPERILQDKLATERRLRRSLQTKLQTRENELDSLIAIQKISQEEYQQSLQKLYAEQSENDKLISDMAERYSTLDYDQMDEFYRQVSYYIEQCEFVKADSLLKTRGNIHVQLESAKQQGQAIQQDEEKLQRAKIVHQHDIDELAKRCYSYYENFKMQHQNDSAAYYLEKRVQLDTTNAQWLDELADFLEEYLAQYEKALEYYQQALAINENIKNDSKKILSFCNIAKVYKDIGDYDAALAYCEKASTLSMVDSVSLESNANARLYNILGIVYDVIGEYKIALDYHQMALSIRIKNQDQYLSEISESYNNIATTYANLGNHLKSLEFYQKAIAMLEDSQKEDNLYIATLYNNIGVIYYNLSDLSFSLEHFQKALKIRMKILGSHHPDIATTYNSIAFIFLTQENYIEALNYFQKAFDIRSKVFGLNHPRVATLYNNIGGVYERQKDYVKALEYFQQALYIKQTILGHSHPDIATSYNNIGGIYDALKNYEQALIYYNKALTIRIDVLGINHPSVANVYNNIGFSHFSQGDNVLALDFFQKAYNIFIAKFGLKSIQVADCYTNIGKVYEANKDIGNAREYYERAFEILKEILGLEHAKTKIIQEKLRSML